MSMGSAKLSELVSGSQLHPLVRALSKLAGLPARLLDADGTVLAASPELPGSGSPMPEGGQCLGFPIEVEGATLAVLQVGPYRPDSRRRRRGLRAAGRIPVLPGSRVEVLKVWSQSFVDLVAAMGLRALELRREREERGRAEAELLARERQYRELVEQMNEGILAGDRNTRITFVNSRMAAMLGYPEEELLGRPFFEIMAPEIRAGYLERLKDRHVGISERYEADLLRKDGGRICTFISASPLRDDRNAVVGSFAVISDITEWKKAEKNLRESEEKFRRLFETMQEVFYRCDREGRLTLMSPSGARLLGYPDVDALIGRDITESMYLDAGERRFFLAAIAEQGFVRDFEVTLRKSDGTPIIVSTYSRLNRDGQGNITGVEGAFFDITERKKTEEALRRSEERYRLIMDNVRDIIFTHLPDGTISFVSGSVSHLGYLPEEIAGRDLFGFVHPDDLEISRNAFLQTLRTLKGSGVEVRIRCKDGGYLWMEEHSDPVLRDGRLIQVTCVLRDITQRRSAEEALHRSEARYSRIVNNIRDIIYSYTPDGVVSFVSGSVRQIGYEVQEIVGKSLYGFLHPQDRPVIRRAVDRAIHEGAFDPVECRLRSKNGAYVWVEANSEPILHEGVLVQINGVARDITESRNAKEALRLSEEKYRRIIDHIQDIIFSYRPDGCLSFVSESIRRLGYEPEDLAGRSILDFIHEEDLGAAKQALARAVECNVHERVEFRVRTRRGDYLWFEENSEPIFQDGVLVQVNAVARDVSGRKAAELALQDSEEKYRCLVEQLREGILVSDLDGTIIFANPRMAEMLGYTVEEIVGRKDSILIREEDLAAYRDRMEHRAGDQFEVRLIRKDGSPGHFLASGTHLLNRDGKRVGSFGVLGDITESKRAQEELKRLSAAIEQASDSVIVADTRGVILYANPASQTLTGLALSELVGNTLDVLRSNKQTDSFYRRLWDTVRRGEAWSGHIINVRADGTRYDTDTTMSPVRDVAGRVQYVVTNSRDITREAELEVQLRHSQRMEAIGVMAGGIAHDFNNILTPVMGYTEMALNRPGLDAKVCGYLKEIASAGRRASELVQQILTFSRQTEQVKQPVQVDSIIKESLKLLRAAIPSTITIRQRIFGRGMQALADASQIHQVVMNLCTNAFHAMRERGGVMEVVLDTTRLDVPLVLLEGTLPAGDYLRLSVSDSGQGMDEETRKKIFLPFFTTKQVGEGTGLGLSIVHGIVVGMGGSIQVDSEVGRGTKFTVYFPSVRLAAGAAASAEPPMFQGSERLLVVDDEKVIGAMLQDALTYAGYEVEMSDSPVRALEWVRRDPGRFDLVVTDLVMPELTGAELAKTIWEIRAGLPVILLTGYAEILDEVSAQEMGFAKMLRKPVPLSRIGQVVRAVLDSRIS